MEGLLQVWASDTFLGATSPKPMCVSTHCLAPKPLIVPLHDPNPGEEEEKKKQYAVFLLVAAGRITTLCACVWYTVSTCVCVCVCVCV